jgi:3',5'-cyclic-nucleotide phosphodiesterase
MASIEVLSGVDAGRRLELRDELTIGRVREQPFSDDCFFVIPEPAVSRQHARIRRRGDGYFIEDLSSTNGTMVGTRRIVPGIPYTLSDGTPIQVSETRFVFHADAASRNQDKSNGKTDGTRRFDVTLAIDAKRLQTELRAGTVDIDRDPARALERLKAITRVSIALGTVRQRGDLSTQVMECIFDIFPAAERAVLMIHPPGGGELEAVAERTRGAEFVKGKGITVSRSIVDDVVTNRRALLSVDTASDERFDPNASVFALKLRSIMCAPLLVDEEVLGVVQVDTRERQNAFSGDDLEVLTGVATQIAVSVKNLQLYEEIDRLFESFIRASVQAIEARDPVTAGHSFRVADCTERLALAVNREERYGLRDVSFAPDQVREIRYAALLHDFGKVTVRETVLTKEKKLHVHQLALVEQRFNYARACLEAKVYRTLVDLHSKKNLSPRGFQREREKVERWLERERERLEKFFEIVAQANEPDFTGKKPPRALKDVARYRFSGGDGTDLPLLQAFEFSDLTQARGSLTPEEREEVQAHVSHSYNFLSLIPWTSDLSRLPDIAHGHHEKLDGSGYPLGLSGDRIPIQVRMLTIADMYDALNAGDRPYKEAIPPERALDILQDEARSGKIDKSLCKIFIQSHAYRSP